jgi:stage V sporulation protein SpoVS
MGMILSLTDVLQSEEVREVEVDLPAVSLEALAVAVVVILALQLEDLARQGKDTLVVPAFMRVELAAEVVLDPRHQAQTGGMELCLQFLVLP